MSAAAALSRISRCTEGGSRSEGSQSLIVPHPRQQCHLMFTQTSVHVLLIRQYMRARAGEDRTRKSF